MTTSIETVKVSPNTLADALSMRYPIVWVNAADTVDVIERVKTHVGLYQDLSFYLFNALTGLQKFNYRTNRFDTVLIETVDPLGNLVQITVDKLDQVVSYLQDDPLATLFVANAEQFEDGLNDVYTFASFAWRNAWLNDQSNQMFFQMILSSTTQSAPPEAVRAYVPTVKFGLPSKNDFVHTLVYIAEKTGADIDVGPAAEASRGLSSFEAIDLYHSMIATQGSVNVQELQSLTFERLASRVGLDIIRPSIQIDQVAGAENLKKILDTSMWIRKNPEEAIKLGHNSAIHRFLALGLPGTGKSMVCEAAANQLHLNLIRTGITQQLSKWHGQSESNMIALFDQIDALDPVAVWCDEFGRDAGGGQSSHVVDAGSTSRMHGIFLTRLQELSDSTYFFAAANSISTLPPEMLRADRFDRIFFFGYPTYEQRYKILSDLLVNIDHQINIDEIAEATGAHTGAELKTAYTIASTEAIADLRVTTTQDMIVALRSMKDKLWTRNRNYVINEYKLALERYHWASDDQKMEASEYAFGRIPKGTKKQPISQKPSVDPKLLNASVT